MVWSCRYIDENEVKIPILGLPNGVYIIRIKTTGKCYYRKFIKKSHN